jgi:hypothetical protein
MKDLPTILGGVLLALLMCSTAAGQPAPASTPEATKMNGSVSPAGEQHPGTILHVDESEGRTWSSFAAEVPPTIAWVKVGEQWQAVVRIVITGTTARRCITKFGRDGAMLETTISA